ncbi:DUF1152 domain-containing protein [Nocardia gipuzkoensis]|uniref:DUF1152 domain-containing protein n=1 Tax=Nocardia gipuzkoensis TaxID=2749991 RepID=UPI00237E4A11|nr:DUF1152 domain-containing protein [Nocardia gipuzkoensis]MDE1671258.1 DUF1152 domain-containing protein [Nocardia gipuzkoensis]
MTSRAIAIAAGGGGDAVTASILAAKLRRRFDVVAIMGYSWDRLIVDPTPGPRACGDFDGLTRHHELIAEVTRSTRLRGPGRSTLPPLVPYLAHPLLLMDPSDGALGLADQFRAASQFFDADTLIVIDIGGDILAEGHETGLRSPLADSFTLAAAIQSELPLHLLVAGVGLDGELTPPELHTLLRRRDAVAVAELGDADVAAVAEVWNWHPSEANGLLYVAAEGWRGEVETQRNALINITDDATMVYEVDASAVAAHSLAAELFDTRSLEQAEQRIRAHRGYSDIDTERDRLSAHREQRTPTADSIGDIDRYARAASLRGVNALTIRRVIELTGAISADAGEVLRVRLGRERPYNLRPPLYLV